MEEKMEQLESMETLNETGSILGKFKDAQALLDAYNNLQSDYTKKCQALSALQKNLKENEDENFSPESKQEELSSEDRIKLLQDYVYNNSDLRDKLLAKYFDDIILPKSPKLIGSDRGSDTVISPVSRPKSLEDAERIVKDMLK